MALPFRIWRLALLSWVAGAIDTFGYLALGRVFISHATGNTAVIAIAIIQRNGHEALRRGLALPAFFAGGLAGAALVDAAEDSRQLARALLIEAVLIVAFVVLVWRLGFDPDVTGPAWAGALVLLATAMGIQNAALTHPYTRGTHTTHITGPLSDVALEIVRAGHPRRRSEFEPLRMARQLSRLIGFLTGALSGALLFQSAPLLAPLVPTAVLLATAVWGLWLGADTQTG